MSRVAGFTSTGSKRPEALFGAAEPALTDAALRTAAACGTRPGANISTSSWRSGAVALGLRPSRGDPRGHRRHRGRRRGAARRRCAEEALAAELCRPDAVGRAGALPQDRRRGDGRRRSGSRARPPAASSCSDADTTAGSTGVRRGEAPASRTAPAPSTASCRSTTRSAPASGSAPPATASRRSCSSRSSSRRPTPEWLAVLREETARAGALLVVDEIKTVCRLAVGGGCERYGIRPDLVVMGKAMANGYPLAAVGGRAEVMELGAPRPGSRPPWPPNGCRSRRRSPRCGSWRSAGCPSTSPASAAGLHAGLARAGAAATSAWSVGVGGLPEMCHLEFRDEAASRPGGRGRAERGLLFKRGAYNFVSLAPRCRRRGSTGRWREALGRAKSRLVAEVRPIRLDCRDTQCLEAPCHRENRPSTIWTIWTTKMECWTRKRRRTPI